MPPVAVFRVIDPVDCPKQPTLVDVFTVTEGFDTTLAITVAVAVQLLASVTVTVYVLLEVRVAFGLATVEELNPVDGLQE